MKKQWLIWGIAAIVVVAVLFAVNYQSQKEAVSLTDIFPEEEAAIEYEFAKDTPQGQTTTRQADVREPSSLATSTPTAQQPSLATDVVKSSSPQPSQGAVESSLVAAEGPVNFSKIPFTIQAASFREKAKAELALRGMKAAGYPAYIKEVNLGDRGTWFRVYIGTFLTKQEADEYLSRVKGSYKDSFIISPNKN